MRFAALIVLILSTTAHAQGPKVVNPVFDAERKVREFLQQNVRDPKKLEFVAFSKPFQPEGCQMRSGSQKKEWGTFAGSGVAIYAKYRTLNTSDRLETIVRVFF